MSTPRSDQFFREHAELLDALMRVMDQRSEESRDGLLHHGGTPEEERAVSALTNAGFAVKKNGGYELLWGNLTERWLEINGKLPSAKVLEKLRGVECGTS